jgi:hypothetical protein
MALQSKHQNHQVDYLSRSSIVDSKKIFVMDLDKYLQLKQTEKKARRLLKELEQLRRVRRETFSMAQRRRGVKATIYWSERGFWNLRLACFARDVFCQRYRRLLARFPDLAKEQARLLARNDHREEYEALIPPSGEQSAPAIKKADSPDNQRVNRTLLSHPGLD